MNEKVYDLAVIWAWAAGIFACINAPKTMSKILIEKNEKIGKKVLLSGGERCNVSNIDITPENDYFGKNKKVLHSLFKKFSNYDMIDWLESRWVQTHIEDRGRIILHSGKAQELVTLLEKELRENNTQILCNFWVESLKKEDEIFVIQSWETKIYAKKVVVSTGGKSFAQVGTDGWGYRLAKEFGIELVEPYKWLCALITKEDLKELSGSTVFLTFRLFDDTKEIYSEYGSFLFTHFWLSGPLVFNGVIRLWEHLREKWIHQDEHLYIKDHIHAKLVFDSEHLTKRVRDFFGLDEENMETTLHINDLRSWAEAKVTWGGVVVDELDKHFQSKKVPGLYFIGEVLDLTGKTGGFNLQVAWSAGYVVWKSFSE